MKQLYISLLMVATGVVGHAQPILSNGFGALAAIDGTLYKKTTGVGNGNFGTVAASADGMYFYATGANTTADKFYWINVASNTITDSISLPNTGSGDMASLNDAKAVFSLRGNAVYRINPQAKTFDSIVLNSVFRIEERPGVKEAWVTVDSTVQVIDYTTGLTMGATIDLSSSKFDNSDVRFTKGGSIAWKSCASRKKIYKMDCATKTVVDSIDTSPNSHAAIEVSSDSSRIYAAKDTAVYIYSVASKTLVDSMTNNKAVMNLYRHPLRQELWAVHHFNDSVTVFKESDKSKIASFDIGNDPFFLAFAPAPTAISDVHTDYNVQLYPNPVTSRMTWILPGGKEHNIVVYDYQGRVVKTLKTTLAKTEMDMAQLPAGNYIGAVYIQGALVKVLPIIKE